MNVIHGQLRIELTQILAQLGLDVVAYARQLEREAVHVELLKEELSQAKERMEQLEQLLAPLPGEVTV